MMYVFSRIACCFLLNFVQISALDLASMFDLIKINNDITYTKCYDREAFNFEPFPLSMWPELQPSRGIIDETFVLQIPKGQIYSAQNIRGHILQNGQFIQEYLWPSAARFMARHKNFKMKNNLESIYIPGRVAVVAQEGKAYFHWMIEVLGRLALLEIFNKQDYDFLYVCASYDYQKEALRLWGIDESKIIDCKNEAHLLQADELIVPSLVCRPYPALGENPLLCAYPPTWLIDYVRNKFLSLSELQQISRDSFAKKVFISRKDSKLRQVMNEDEVFAVFEKQGFVRYELAHMSLLEQIALFNNAEMIVGFHGSGLTNILFCDPGTRIIEIFQERGDCTFWYMSQMLGLHHTCVKTMDFLLQGAATKKVIPIAIINDLVKSL